MNRRILILVTAPAVLIGLLLLGACLIGIWQINRLQTNMTQILAENVGSLRAAQQMEIALRRLRFHCYLYLVEPTADYRDKIHADHERFEKSLASARLAARQPQERAYLESIDAGYRRYRKEFDELSAQAARDGPFRNFHQLADANPVQHVVDPCRELLQANQQQMENVAQDAYAVSSQVRWVMYFLGFGGPLGGVVIGYGVARGLSRSIYQLSVRIQNMAQRLDQDVTSVSLAADGDIQYLDRQLQYIVSRVEEVAERLQRQQRDMLRAEQLSAVGQLAASVAHEVRNPLAGIKMLVEAALRPANPLPLTRDDFEVIHREIDRVETTVQGLLDFARLPTPQRTLCDVRQLLSRAVDLVSSRARQQKVEIVVRCPAEPALGDVDPNQLNTVMVNLLLNALDAMPRGGAVAVELDTSDTGAMQLAVTDSGSGIAPEMMDRLFVPFSSTKATGTGLGLCISRRIVEEHGGQLNVSNRSTGGACFTMSLPAPARRATASTDGAAPVPAPAEGS